MKKIVGFILVLALLASIGGTGYYLWKKSRKPAATYLVESPARATIVHKAVATGAVVPRKEVEIKSLIPGIIETLHVEPGQRVERNSVLATVRVVPDMVNLSGAESRVNRSRIALADAERELQRNRGLRDERVVSDAVLQQSEKAWENAKEEVAAAVDNLDLLKIGTTRRDGATTNTLVRATIGGMVLTVPREAGNSVIPSNNFNDGTTIATIADMDDLIFKGKVDESEVGKLKEGMELVLKVGALEGKVFSAVLEHIAPRGVDDNGAIKFEIRAALNKPVDPAIRANLSANADIVLAKKEDVLAIDESLLQFDKGKPFVEVEGAPQTFTRREIQTGLSDGIKIEIVSGLKEDDRIKNATRSPKK